ncbi:MAG: GHMP kinase [Candidatus Levyibacteriota bacterium]|nr:MAG: GHMP kinase [Candidatus Levybacteria bacterium]
MIISRTPLRISFVGGGSDIAAFYQHTPGAVVTTAVNKYVYIAVNKQFDGRILINYSKTEIVNKVSDIENNLVREALKLTGVMGGIHITSVADIPSEGTGMGSSSSYLVGLLNALYAFQGKHVNAERLARDASKIEIDILKKPIGKQDQYIAAYGGLQFMQFNSDSSVYVDPIICKAEIKRLLEKRLLLFYTGITRSSDPILAKQTNNMATQKKKRQIMRRMVLLAKKMQIAINKNNLASFGEMLHENWTLKTQMAEGVTNFQINKWYETGRKNGALGGKLLGAGGGGFLLFYAIEEKHKKIIHALSDLIYQDLTLEPQGSKIVFID